MGKLKLRQPVDMRGSGEDFSAARADVSDDRIVYESNRITLVYDGDFEVQGGRVTGTVERVKVLVDDETLYVVKEIAADMAEHLEAWEDDGYKAATRILLEGDDKAVGSSGNDAIFAGDGDDKLKGKEGQDELRGGKGADKLKGKEGEDRLFGQGGDDKLKGDEGDDELYGGDGDDKLRGGDGSDLLFGEDGDDRLKGGEGADIFVFDGDDGRDLVRDFEEGVDRIAVYGGVDPGDVDVEETDDGIVLSFGGTEILLRGVETFDESRILDLG